MPPAQTGGSSPGLGATGLRMRCLVVRSIGVGRGHGSPAMYERRQRGGPSRSPSFPGLAVRSARAVGDAAGRWRHWHSCVERRVSRCHSVSSAKIWGQLARLTESCGSRCSSKPAPSSWLWRIESFPRPSEGRPGRVGFPAQSELCPAVPPAEQDMREVGLPAVEVWCGTGGFRKLSTAARFPRVLSTDSGSRPYRPAIPAALRARTSDERRAVVGGLGHGSG